MALRLLSLVGPLHIIVGVLLFLTAFLPDVQQSIASAAALDGDRFSPFLFSVFGPTLASWGVLFTSLARQFADYPAKRLWNAMLYSILVWAPMDTGLCLYFGITAGVIVNCVVTIVLLAVLFKVKTHSV
jgi:hypothetical protein